MTDHSLATADAGSVPARPRRALAPSRGGRPWTFYVLATLFTLYVIALYGPMVCIYILSFQDVRGGLVFPMRGTSLHWFVDLFTQVRTGDVKGAFSRSIRLAVVVTVITVVISFMSGLAFRKRFAGDSVVFYLMIGSLVAPGLVLGIGVGLICNVLGIETSWYTTALGAQLSWTLPFGVLVMFAVMSRFNNAWEEAARDLGASAWQTTFLVIVPDSGAGPGRGSLVRLHAVLRRVHPHPADRWFAQHPATRDLEHDAECHLAVAVRARHGNDADLVPHHRRLPRHHRANPEAARGRAGGTLRNELATCLSKTEASNWRGSSRAMTAPPGSSTAST